MPESPSQPLVGLVQKRDNYICQYCGKDGLATLDNWHDCTIDHIVPASAGGDLTDPSNLVTSCGYCNAIKGPRVFKTLQEAKAYVTERRAQLKKDYERVCKAVRRS